MVFQAPGGVTISNSSGDFFSLNWIDDAKMGRIGSTIVLICKCERFGEIPYFPGEETGWFLGFR